MLFRSGLYVLLEPFKDSKLEGTNKDIFDEGVKILSQQENLRVFFDNGVQLHNEAQYEKSRLQFKKIVDFGENSYFYAESIFYYALNNEFLDKNEEAIKYYEKYYNDYKGGVYTAGTLYSLAILYRDTDVEKAKNYSKELKENYPKSIYNNEHISAILNK